MAPPPNPGNNPHPTNQFIQLVGVYTSLYALDNAGNVFRFVVEKDSWFPISMQIVVT